MTNKSENVATVTIVFSTNLHRHSRSVTCLGRLMFDMFTIDRILVKMEVTYTFPTRGFRCARADFGVPILTTCHHFEWTPKKKIITVFIMFVLRCS